VLLLILAGVSASAEEMPEDGTCAFEGSESTPCLLQNHFIKNNPLSGALPEAGLVSKTDKASDSNSPIALEDQEADLNLFQSSSTKMVLTMLMQTKERCDSFQAHNFYLGRKARGLKDYFAMLAMTLGNLANATAPREHESVVVDDPKTRGEQEKVLPDDPDDISVFSLKHRHQKEKQIQKPDEKGAKKDEKEKEKKGDEPKEKGDEPDEKKEDKPGDEGAKKEKQDNAAQTAESDRSEKKDTDENKESGQKTEEGDDAPAKGPKFDVSRMNNIIDNFLDSQSGSEDDVHYKLLQSQKQLAELQSLLNALVIEVNTTENSLILYDRDLQQKLQQLADIEKWKDGALGKCKTQTEEEKRMYVTLSKQLMEMHEEAVRVGAKGAPRKLALAQTAARATVFV
jgi:hypothetical protein